MSDMKMEPGSPTLITATLDYFLVDVLCSECIIVFVVRTKREENEMNVQQLLQDIESGCLTEVTEAANQYYDEARGLSVYQRFFVYPNDTIACMNSVDGGNAVLVLSGDDEATFRSLYSAYFN
jgi:hypothetical protein